MSGILSKLKNVFSKTTDKVSSIFGIKKIDATSLANLEDALLKADFGVDATADILAKVGKEKPKDIPEYMKNYLHEHLYKFESNLLDRQIEDEIFVILVVGVNGNGKTTSVAKLAHHFQKLGKNPRIAACDTFRAAATEQLVSWAKKIQCPITTGKENSDPSSVAYGAYKDAQKSGNKVLIIDTAGRLHTRSDLMDELQKIKRVLKKFSQNVPHETVLVLDGTTGQSAFSQVFTFKESIGLDSIIVTKLDSSSKGGAIVGLTKQYNLPISAICFGEGIDDIRKFSALEYARSIF